MSAQLSAQPASAPSQPPAQSATTSYESAFEGYRPFEATEVQDWRKSNDTVREIGGWRAYAREMREGQTQAPPGQPKAADAHQGHHK